MSVQLRLLCTHCAPAFRMIGEDSPKEWRRRGDGDPTCTPPQTNTIPATLSRGILCGDLATRGSISRARNLLGLRYCLIRASVPDGLVDFASHEIARRGSAHHTDLPRCHDKAPGCSPRCLLLTKIEARCQPLRSWLSWIPLPPRSHESSRTGEKWLGAERIVGKLLPPGRFLQIRTTL